MSLNPGKSIIDYDFLHAKSQGNHQHLIHTQDGHM